MRSARVVTGICVLALAAAASPKRDIVGGISSTAPVEIDGTSMDPAPSWPVVDRDDVQTTSAPGLLLTPDRNAITLMPETGVRVRTSPTHQTWVFVRQGGVTVSTKNRSVLVCIGNRLFAPSASARGSLSLDRSGSVSRSVSSGVIEELNTSGCADQAAADTVQVAARPVAGGTASAGGGFGKAGIVSVAAVAASAGVTAGVAAASSPCASSTGCNFNPASISPSGP
jgi:hypothetical protein